MKKMMMIAVALVSVIATLPVVTPVEAKKSCNYTSGDKAKGYRC
jgi:uncharacterized protein YjeT (DUF2065 family)